MSALVIGAPSLTLCETDALKPSRLSCRTPKLRGASLGIKLMDKSQNSGEACVPLERLVLPPVLDVCCGPRSMWFDKKDKRGLFVDRREEEHEKPRKCRKNVTKISIRPDVLADFTQLPFPDESFRLVVMDPPHYTEGMAGKGHIFKHYGCLFPGWQEMLAEGFKECFRVLKPEGTFIFKWCEVEIPLSSILELTPEKPLFGHRTGRRENTHWVTFIKQNDRH